MTNLPKTYKAIVIEKPQAPWSVKEVELKEPKEGQIVIKSEACGICHSDCALQQGHFGPMAQFPIVPGHEVIGKVVAVAPNEKRWKIGDRVGGAWHGYQDGTCKACNRGLFQMCENAQVNGVTKDGGFGEYATLWSNAAVKIPTDLDAAEAAPLLCAGVTVFNGIRNMNITAGDIVAIQGLGGLGHLAVQYSRKMGYNTVAISSSDAKKEFATQLGANHYIDTSKEDAAEALQKLGGASLVVITAPNPDIMGKMVNACGPLGKVLILAPVGDVPVPTASMIMKGISVHGWPSGHALDSEEAIAFAQNQGVKCMVEKCKLEDVTDSVKKMEDGKIRFRGVIVFE